MVVSGVSAVAIVSFLFGIEGKFDGIKGIDFLSWKVQPTGMHFQSVEEMSSGLTRAAESDTSLKKRVGWREPLSGNWSG
eukprot:3027680-Rhodomonas_salina.1